MERVIYADVLIVINVYVNYLLLILTSCISETKLNRLRAVMTSLSAGIFSLIILIPGINDLLLTVIRIVFLVLVVLFAFEFKSIKLFLKILFIFLAVNFAFAGIIFALWLFVSGDNIYFYNGIVYFDIDLIFLIITTVVCYLFLKIFSYLNSRRACHDLIYDIELYINNEIIKAKAFYDSGNNLIDPFTGEGVTIVSLDIIRKALKINDIEDLLNHNHCLKVHLIPCESVNNASLIPVFRCERLCIIKDKSKNEFFDVLVGVSKNLIRNGEFGALLNSSVAEKIMIRR